MTTPSVNGDSKTAGPPAVLELCNNVEAGEETVATTTNEERKAAVSRVIRRAFDDPKLEEAYQAFIQRSKASDLDCFFLTGCLVAVHATVTLSLEQNQTTTAASPQVNVLVSAGFSSIVAIAMASLGFYIRSRNHKAVTVDPTPAPVIVTDRLLYAAWLLANVLILAQLVFVPTSWALTWLLLVNFLTCITLSVRLRICLLLTTGSSLLFLALSLWIGWDAPVVPGSRPLHQQVI